MVDDLMPMGSTEGRHLREIAEGWAEYGPALKLWLELDGGMTWKDVSGAEYLCRYRQDPETGKKKFTSLGRRSAETERTYDLFIERRDRARATVLAKRDWMLTAGRVAKAYGLARLPAAAGEILHVLWLRSADDELRLFGGSALLFYEIKTEVLAPKDLVRDDRLTFIFGNAARAETVEKVADAIEGALRERPHVRDEGSRLLLHCRGDVELELLDGDVFFDRGEPAAAAALAEALDLAAVRGLTVARDAQTIEFAVPDPRAYAMMAEVLGRDDEVWRRRAEHAATLVRERWDEPFDERQEAAFPDLRGNSDGHRSDRLWP
jgi:hypothetical protein